MSEVRDMIERFQDGAQAEYCLSGAWPRVCIMGHHDFEGFAGCVEALYEIKGTFDISQFQAPEYKTVLKAKAKRTMMFQNIRIFASYANETGMVFGGPERE